MSYEASVANEPEKSATCSSSAMGFRTQCDFVCVYLFFSLIMKQCDEELYSGCRCTCTVTVKVCVLSPINKAELWNVIYRSGHVVLDTLTLVVS